MSFLSSVFFVLHVIGFLALRFYASGRGGLLWTFLSRTALAALALTLFSGLMSWIDDSRSVTFSLASAIALFIFGAIVAVIHMFFFGYNPAIGAGHVRGAAVAGEREIAKQMRGARARFSVGAVPVPVELETRGFLLAGAPGTGKSQTLTHALDALRGQSAAIVADASGIYTSRYYRDGHDVIVNPFDSRSAPWSPLAEIETFADIPALAKSLIPDAEGSAAEWNRYAQTVVEAVLQYAHENDLTNKDIFDLACVAPIEKLRDIFAGTPAAPLVAEGNERMFGSVRAIVGSYLRFMQYLDPAAGANNGFSVRRWVLADQPRYMFLSYQQQHRDALKSMIACCLDVAARAVLSLPPSLDRRVVFAIDEMPLLGKVQSIVDLATNGRKHGAVIFGGLQTISQLRDCYGRETAQTLLACLGSWLVLRVADAETAEYMSRYLGEEEKVRIVQSGGESSKGLETTNNSGWSQQYTQSRVVLPSELQNLPDLHGFFNLAGPVPTARIHLQIARERKSAEAYIPAPAPKKREPRHDAQLEKAREQTMREQAQAQDMLHDV